MPENKLTPRELKLSNIEEATRTVTFTASTTDFVKEIEFVHDPKTKERSERVFYEAIVEWDFTRFLENPVVLWSHDTYEIPIGRVIELSFDPENGLVVAIKFAPEKVSEKAERVFQAIREELIRAISVGFDRESIISVSATAGEPRRKIRASLNEVSVVTVPKDAGALARGQRAHLNANGDLQERSAEEEEDEQAREEREAREASEAAKKLASRRRPKVATDDEDLPVFDSGSRLDAAQVEHTGFGIRIPARFGKVGVLTYRLPDGSTRRELRHPDEVFAVDSIATLRSAPATINHPYHLNPPFVTPEHHARLAKGHVEAADKKGDYLSGPMMVTDAETISAIDSGELVEISPGYTRKLDRTPGVWNGQTYDAVQREIRYNHVALLPPGRGRAGADVAVLLDESDALCVEETKEQPMAETKKMIALDGRDYEYGSEAHITKLQDMHSAALDAKEQELTKVRKDLDAVQAALDSAEAEEERAKKAAEEAKAEEDAEKAKKAKEEKGREKVRIKRALRAVRVMEMEEDEDEEALDSRIDEILDMDDRAIMVKVIQHSDPAFVADGKSDDYIEARFDMVEAPVTDSLGSIVRKVEETRRAGGKPDAVEEARQKNLERARSASITKGAQ